ncbi:hypothetical protein [Anaeromyxobacter oryzisoli]|uniref:hypothetical protein n=1 Tax=Anaeromyxobacter oryzisoli TaxID=2925408 RepID=UPI001F592246|nr:hypothetical protein [Anaeromyxobacter sp. SG63]
MRTGKHESERLMNELLPLARRMLREFGEFHPFGGALKTDGTFTHLGATTERDYGPSSELIKLLERDFHDRASAGTIRAAAIVTNRSLGPSATDEMRDAIEVRVDHVDGFSANVYFPYALNEGQLRVESPFATKGVAFAFGKVEDA